MYTFTYIYYMYMYIFMKLSFRNTNSTIVNNLLPKTTKHDYLVCATTQPSND